MSFESTVWQHAGPAAWWFISLPADCADEVGDHVAGRTKAFGSVRVRVRVGSSSWSTSLFPDKGSGTYVLPLKRAVRSAEGLLEGSPVTVHLEVVEP